MRACLLALLLAAPACSSEAPCDPSGGRICTIAGTGESSYGGDGGPALEAGLSLPQDVLLSPAGDLYVLDWNNHRLRAVTPEGTMIHVAGRGEVGGGLDDSGAENSDFHHPTSVLLEDGGRTVLIAAWHNNKVRSLDVESGAITDTCGAGDPGYAGDGGPATEALLDLPASIARGPDGDLFVMDQGNQVIRRIDASGSIHRFAGRCVTERPGGCGDLSLEPCPGSDKLSCDPLACGAPCQPGFAGDGDSALEARLAQPPDLPGGRLVVTPGGDVLFADSANHVIRRIDPSGVINTVAGTPPTGDEPQRGYGGDGGPASAALLDNPVDLALADDGTLYVSDVDNHCVRAIDPAGIIDTVAGTCGERGYAGDGGPATEALLTFPYGIDVAGDTLYIADMGNSTIRSVGLP